MVPSFFLRPFRRKSFRGFWKRLSFFSSLAIVLNLIFLCSFKNFWYILGGLIYKHLAASLYTHNMFPKVFHPVVVLLSRFAAVSMYPIMALENRRVHCRGIWEDACVEIIISYFGRGI